MINRMDRTLTIMADGEPVTGYARVRLLGTERMGLYPSLFMLHLWNVAEEDYLALSRSKEVTVLHDDVVLVSGSFSALLYDKIRGVNLGLCRQSGTVHNRTVLFYSHGIGRVGNRCRIHCKIKKTSVLKQRLFPEYDPVV